MIRALYRLGISHKCAIHRGSWVDPRAPSRVPNRHPAGSVDQGDHGGSTPLKQTMRVRMTLEPA
jgi:hypothetical protein